MKLYSPNVGTKKAPRALLARARGKEMLTRFQRALRPKLRPFGRYQRAFGTYPIAPDYLHANSTKNQPEPS